MSCRRAARVPVGRHGTAPGAVTIIGALTPEPDNALDCPRRHRGSRRSASTREPQGRARVGPASARYREPPREPPRAAAPGVAMLPTARRFSHGVSGRLADPGEDASRGNGSRRSPGVWRHRGRGPGGDLGRPAAGDGARCGALHARPRHPPSGSRGTSASRPPGSTADGARRSPPRSHHIETVNALIGRFRAFMQPSCGPSSRNLAPYSRWHAARGHADRGYLDPLRPLLASGPSANTVCRHHLADAGHEHRRDAARLLVHADGAQIVRDLPFAMDAHGDQVVEN